MGEAKRRGAARKLQEQQLVSVDVSRVAYAVRHVAAAVTVSLGKDCYLHALIGTGLLARLGVESRMVVGFAAWRTGNGDADVISSTPESIIMPQQGFPYHTWLEIGHYILDLTTYQLRVKAQQLEALDGMKTCIDWCPDYLFEKKETVSSLKDTINNCAGLYYYKRDVGTERIIDNVNGKLDDKLGELIDMALLVYKGVDISSCFQQAYFWKDAA